MSINTSGSESKARVRLTAMPTKTRSFEAQPQQVTQSVGTADGGWSPTVGHRQLRASQTDFEVLAPSERGPAEQPSREGGSTHPRKPNGVERRSGDALWLRTIEPRQAHCKGLLASGDGPSADAQES